MRWLISLLCLFASHAAVASYGLSYVSDGCSTPSTSFVSSLSPEDISRFVVIGAAKCTFPGAAPGGVGSSDPLLARDRAYLAYYYPFSSDTPGSCTTVAVEFPYVVYVPGTLCVTALNEPAPDMSRRVSSFPVGEVAVMCAALLAFFVGFRTGMA